MVQSMAKILAEAEERFMARKHETIPASFATVTFGGAYGALIGGPYMSLDDALVDIELIPGDPDFGVYYGTIHIAADGDLTWLDLRPESEAAK